MNQDESLKTRLQELGDRIANLLLEVDESVLEKRKRAALQKISDEMTKMLFAFGVEGAQDPAELNTRELTLQISRSGRRDYLAEVGSASNWLGYHLSILLSLHLYFLSLERDPVPGFLMLDQPSQVYFPTKLAGKKKDIDLDEDDRFRVRAIFIELARVVSSTKGKLQLIVVDHAGKDIWGDLPGVHPVGDWRGQTRLIPQSWISSSVVEGADKS
jgi:hypothetical protein